MSDEIGPEERARRALNAFLDRLVRTVVEELVERAPRPAQQPDPLHPVLPVSQLREGEDG